MERREARAERKAVEGDILVFGVVVVVGVVVVGMVVVVVVVCTYEDELYR